MFQFYRNNRPPYVIKKSTLRYYFAIANRQELFIIYYLGIFVKQFVVTNCKLLDNGYLYGLHRIQFYIHIRRLQKFIAKGRIAQFGHTRRDMQTSVGIYCVMNRIIQPSHIMSNILGLILPSGFFRRQILTHLT